MFRNEGNHVFSPVLFTIYLFYYVQASYAPERYRNELKDCIARSYAITRLYNSVENIDVPAYRRFCRETKVKFLTAFNGNGQEWIYLTPTVHSVLDHAADLIEANGCEGLLEYSESGLECNNKFLRLLRISLSRKTSQTENLTDCLIRLAVRADPEVSNAVPEPKMTKATRERVKFSFKGEYPLVSLSDYYVKSLIKSSN